MQQHGVEPRQFSDDYIQQAIALVKSRANFVNDLWDQANFFFVRPTTYNEKDVRKRWQADTPAILQELLKLMKGYGVDCEPEVMAWIEQNGFHKGNVMNALRLTLVGECRGPHIFDITRLLGINETMARVSAGIRNIPVPATDA